MRSRALNTTPTAQGAPTIVRRMRRLVIVDDNHEDRAEIRRLLMTGGAERFVFSEAETGVAAVQLVLDPKCPPPYCVVLDHNLPDMDAPAVLTALTKADGVLYCPVVVLTGNARASAARNVLRAGAQDFIGKSWMTAEGLTRAVENAVERFDMERGLRVRNESIAEMQLRASDLLHEDALRKDQFLATLAHELRNPLAPLSSGLELLRLVGDPATASLRDMMERQVRNLVRLVDDLLDVSRISNGKITIEHDTITLQSVVACAVETSRPLIEAAKHELTIKVPDSAIWILGDLTRLTQVVGNLLNNAAKYTPDHGRITLGVSLQGDHVLIHVIDSGIGIAPDMVPTVFEMFKQADHTSARAASGLGIGLTLVQRFVEMHGGTVRAESPGLGLGSTFTVCLPVAATPSSSTHPPPPTHAATETRHRRILVVDDNVDAAEALAALLRLSGHTVRTSHDGNDALIVARAFEPEAGFIDLGLPGMDGQSLARSIRSDVLLGGMLLVAVTGLGTDEDRRQTKLAGFDGHLTKPAQWEQVKKCLEQVLNS